MLERAHKSKPFSYKRNSAVDKTNNKNAGSATKLWQARQLKEYRRVNKLCYKCGDKYVPNHKCILLTVGNLPGQLSVITSDTGDGGGFIPDDILNMLESHIVD
jgi:hypothetical protein